MRLVASHIGVIFELAKSFGAVLAGFSRPLKLSPKGVLVPNKSEPGPEAGSFEPPQELMRLCISPAGFEARSRLAGRVKTGETHAVLSFGTLFSCQGAQSLLPGRADSMSALLV